MLGSIEIEFKKTHPDAVLSKQAHDTDSGYDLTAVEERIIPAKGFCVVPIGLTVAFITPDYWFRIEARGGLGFKHHLFPHFGIVDNGYRGDCGIKLYNFGDKDYKINKGDRIAQLVVYPLIKVNTQFVEDINETERGSNAFGSSDRRV